MKLKLILQERMAITLVKLLIPVPNGLLQFADTTFLSYGPARWRVRISIILIWF